MRSKSLDRSVVPIVAIHEISEPSQAEIVSPITLVRGCSAPEQDMPAVLVLARVEPYDDTPIHSGAQQ